MTESEKQSVYDNLFFAYDELRASSPKAATPNIIKLRALLYFIASTPAEQLIDEAISERLKLFRDA